MWEIGREESWGERRVGVINGYFLLFFIKNFYYGDKFNGCVYFWVVWFSLNIFILEILLFE